MRIKLKERKQKELILLAKKTNTWGELSKKLNLNENYLSQELGKEKRLLHHQIYKKLCKLAKVDYNKHIDNKLHNNWGQSKGGLNSPGSLIKLSNIMFDENLAEFVGAVLGDGHVCFYKKGKKIGVYIIRIAGDLNKDRDYHVKYLKKLCRNIFNLEAKERRIEKKNERFLDIHSRELVNLFISMGIKPGNKIKNQSTIPKWIFEKSSYLGACLKGLIDTDGCIHRMSRKDPHLIRINFKNHNKRLLEDTRKAFIILGFNPSKIILGNVFYISRQDEISKYLKEIGFSNKKHIDRAKRFCSPMV